MQTTVVSRSLLLLTGLALATALVLWWRGPSVTSGIVDEPITHAAAEAAITLTPIGTYEAGVSRRAAAEIVAFNAATNRKYVANGLTGSVEVIDLSDPTTPVGLYHLETIGTSAADGSTIPAGASANSVATRSDGLGVIAVASDPKTDDGWLVFFDGTADAPTLLGAVRVGAQPDMVAMSPDGHWAVAANEGEPSADYTVDPEGSIAVVGLPAGIEAPGQDAVRIADFHAFEEGGDKTLPGEVRIFGGRAEAGTGTPDNPVSESLEPEYVAIDATSRMAYVTLQEANAVAVVDLASATVTDIWPLGFIDHGVPGNGLDPSDHDGGIDIRTFPGLRGMHQPDGIKAYTAGGSTYLVTANEGGDRGWGDYVEEVRVDQLGEGDLPPICDDSPLANLTDDANLGRLHVSRAEGLSDDGGCYEELYAFGGRSFTIWTPDGQEVFHSGDGFERVAAEAVPESFNAPHTESSLDARSGKRGPEPENLTLGEVDDRTYAFIGLEQLGGIIVYDITAPEDTFYVTYVNNRDFVASSGTVGDRGPEGLEFVPAEESPNGQPLVLVANEVSGSTTVYEVSITNVPDDTGVRDGADDADATDDAGDLPG